MGKTTQYDIKLKEEVTAQLRSMDAKWKDFQETVSKTAVHAKSMDDSFKFMSGMAGTLAGVATAFAFIKAGAFDSAKAFGDMEEAHLKLNAQLQMTSSNLGMNANQLINLANSIEGATGIDDGDVMKSMSLLQTFENVRGDVFQGAIQQSANLSVVFGDIDTATRQLGAALNNPIDNLDKLKKAGIDVTDAEKARYAQMITNGNLDAVQVEILQKVKDKYDGLAETINTGFNGSLRNLANTWDDTFKIMGENVAKFLQPAMDWLSTQLGRFNSGQMLAKIKPEQEAALQAIYGKVQGLSNLRDPKQLDKAQTSISGDIDKLQKSGYDITQIRDAVRNQIEAITENVNRIYSQVKPEERQKILTEQTAYLTKWDNMLTAVVSQYDTINGNKAIAASKGVASAPALESAKKLAETVPPKTPEQLAAEQYQKTIESVYTKKQQLEKELQDLQSKGWKSGSDAENKRLEAVEVVKAKIIANDQEIETNRIKAIQDEAQAEVDRTAANIKQSEDYWKNVAEQEKKAADQKKKDDKEANDAVMNGFKDGFNAISGMYNAYASLMSTITSIQSQQNQAVIDSMRSNFDQWSSFEEQKIAQAEANGQDTTQMELDYMDQKRAKQNEINEKEKDFKKKAFEANKQAQLLGAIMGTANAVVNALGAFPFGPWNIAEAAVVGVLGAAQVGIIASQPTPQFADGGVVPGNSYYGDKILARLNSGEVVLNQKQQKNAIGIMDSKSADASQGLVLQINGDVVGVPRDDFVREVMRQVNILKAEGRISK